MTSSTIPIQNAGQAGFLATATICMFVPTFLVLLRLFARRRNALAFNASDFCIVAALTFEIGLCIVDYLMVFRGGFGLHTSVIEQQYGRHVLTTFYKCMAAWPLLWNCCVMTSKWSVLLMYQTLMPVPHMKLAVRAVGSFVLLFNIGGVLEALLICRPYAKNYDQDLPGTCGDIRAFYIWLSALNLVSDLVILLLPVPFIYKLQLPLRKRLGLVAMFLIGVLTCVVTLYRQTTLPALDLADATSSGLLAFLASTIEIAVAISIACLPFLRSLCSCAWRRDKGGSGGGGGSEYSRDAANKSALRRPDGFGYLPDDSSSEMVRLRAMEQQQQDTVISADGSGDGGGDGGGAYYLGADRGLVVKVETRWDVRRSTVVPDGGESV